VFRKVFRHEEGSITGGWREIRNKELHNLYSPRNRTGLMKSRRMRWVMHVANMGVTRNAYKILVVKSEGRRPLGRPRLKWEDNIKLDLQ
jgi:hypothetical protein